MRLGDEEGQHVARLVSEGGAGWRVAGLAGRGRAVRKPGVGRRLGMKEIRREGRKRKKEKKLTKGHPSLLNQI
jgi:hypothetical protein